MHCGCRYCAQPQTLCAVASQHCKVCWDKAIGRSRHLLVFGQRFARACIACVHVAATSRQLLCNGVSSLSVALVVSMYVLTCSDGKATKTRAATMQAGKVRNSSHMPGMRAQCEQPDNPSCLFKALTACHSHLTAEHT